MRIISGNFKGKKILQPSDIKTRPLKDLTKESIFNIINHSKKFSINFKESNVLDLFSGVGSFGIECLSRGVKSVYFVENYIGALKILEQNLNNLQSIKNFKIIKKDIYNEDIFKNFDKNFDIIFLDPPYKDKNIKSIFKKIENSNIINKGTILILHRHKNDEINFLQNFKILEERKYGISKITFLSFLN